METALPATPTPVLARLYAVNERHYNLLDILEAKLGAVLTGANPSATALAEADVEHEFESIVQTAEIRLDRLESIIARVKL